MISIHSGTVQTNATSAGLRAVLTQRIRAGVLDLLVLYGVESLVGLAFGRAYYRAGSALHVTSVVIGLLVALAYYFFAEAVAGQTLGKRLAGVRVVRLDGSRVSTAAIAIRTLLRPVDFVPLFYLCGFIVLIVSGRRQQRLGDLAAGTTVKSVS